MEIHGDVGAWQQVLRMDAEQKDKFGVEPDHTAAAAGKLYPRIAECQGVADEKPVNADDRQGDHAVHHRAKDVFAPRHAAVEERQAGSHEHHQGRGDQHPGAVGSDGNRSEILLRLPDRFWHILFDLFNGRGLFHGLGLLGFVLFVASLEAVSPDVLSSALLCKAAKTKNAAARTVRENSRFIGRFSARVLLRQAAHQRAVRNECAPWPQERKGTLLLSLQQFSCR